MIKCVLTFVSGVQESVLPDFVSLNYVKILHKVKTCQNCLHQKFPYKNIKSIYFLYMIFRIFELILRAVLCDCSEIVAIVKLLAIIEKEAALDMHEISGLRRIFHGGFSDVTS